MPMYLCRVADNLGKTQEMTRESSSEDSLIRELQNQGFHPLKISEQAEYGGKSAAPERRLSHNAVLDFTQTMGLLLSSGLSLKDALQVALTIFKKGQAHAIISQILEKINKGTSFSNTLTGFSGIFPPLYRGLVRIGEKIGSLDLIFSRLTKYLTDKKKIKEKIVGSLIYPVIILCIIVVFALLMTFVAFPAIADVFKQFGAQAVADIESRLVIYNIIMVVFVIVILALGAAMLFLRFLRRQGGAVGVRIDALMLRLPLAGTIILYQENMNFLFAMETLTGSGYPVEQALQEASLVLKNNALKAAVLDIREQVIRGDAISTAFQGQTLFPERIAQWLMVGERSGQVEKVFAQLNVYYQGEIEKWTTRFMALIDPLLTVFIGAVVLAFVLLFLLPIFTMSANVLK